ncbi:MAG TPA: hypothetical protein VEP90_26480 [Methylomirabilota bacterium]|nr:hypothetical protein [Methylomirabilota bacterium]
MREKELKKPARSLMGLDVPNQPESIGKRMVLNPVPNALAQVTETNSVLSLSVDGTDQPLRDSGFLPGDLLYLILAARPQLQ